MENVPAAVEAWLPAFDLPAPPAAGGKDLRGLTVRVAKFTDQDTVRFFFPLRTLIFQQRMVKELLRTLQRRGAKMESATITPEDYARWCEAYCNVDTPELRFRYATSPPR